MLAFTPSSAPRECDTFSYETGMPASLLYVKTGCLSALLEVARQHEDMDYLIGFTCNELIVMLQVAQTNTTSNRRWSPTEVSEAKQRLAEAYRYLRRVSGVSGCEESSDNLGLWPFYGHGYNIFTALDLPIED